MANHIRCPSSSSSSSATKHTPILRPLRIAFQLCYTHAPSFSPFFHPPLRAKSTIGSCIHQAQKEREALRPPHARGLGAAVYTERGREIRSMHTQAKSEGALFLFPSRPPSYPRSTLSQLLPHATKYITVYI